ncbi:MAG: adenylosuccinate synthetase, partial [Clostridia bacterium]
NLLPSGILREDVVNVMGNGMVIDLAHLCGEMQRLREAGVAVTPERLRISNRAVICMPYHRQQDCLEEDRLADAKFGSTRRGIGPVYGDKYMKKALQMGDLLEPARLKERLERLVEWKNLTLVGGYGAQAISVAEMMDWLETFGAPLRPYLCDAGAYLAQSARAGKHILLEAQLGALRDIEFGIYPYTSSSSTLAAYAPIGAGVPGLRVDHVLGIMKAYATCVGEGPFVCEMHGADAHALREAGGEYGAATGRPRRVGGFDVVASRYGVRMQGADALALTKLDVLSALARIPVCTAYRVDGGVTYDFPMGGALERAEPVIELLDGWQCDIRHCRTEAELPPQARAYIAFLERAVACPITYVSVGADREEYFMRS